MKAKPMVALLGLALVAALAGCGGGSERVAPCTTQGVADVLQTQADAADGAEVGPAANPSFVGDATERYAAADIDIDLTAMGADMVCATVFDMMNNPATYEGKVIRMEGPFQHSHYDETGMDYFFVIVRDATACCAQGIEFVWGDGSHDYPGEYPFSTQWGDVVPSTRITR